MKVLGQYICLFGLLLILTGCDNKNLAIWSPDGSKLGMIATDGFRVSSATGELSVPLIQKSIIMFSWFADSKRIAAVSQEMITNWDDLKTKLSDEDRQAIVEAGPKVMDSIRLLGPESEKIWNNCPGFDMLSKQCAGWVYLKQQYRDELKTLLNKKWKDIEEVGVGVESIETYELEPNVKQIKTLYCTLNDIAELRVSPTNKQIVFVEDQFAGTIDSRSEKPHKLLVLSAEGGDANIVSTHSADYPDWSPDGKHLVYCESTNAAKDDPIFGTIKQYSPEDGEASLAYVRFSNGSCIRCLKNNTILFSTQEIHLPATVIDSQSNVQLFAINPGKSPTVTRLSLKGSNETFNSYLYAFEPSIDGHYAAIVYSSGSVSILDLYTGNVQTLQTDKFDSPHGLYVMPQWKNSDQLTFAAHVSGKPKTKHAADIVLWSISKQSGEILTKDWPNSAFKDFLQ